MSLLPPGILMSIGARRGTAVPCPPPPPPPLWPCNKMLKPNFHSVIPQTNNGCSLLSLILAKLLVLDISCENIFALFMVTALTACPFSIKKCGKMIVFLWKTTKIGWRPGATPPDPLSFRQYQILGAPLYMWNAISSCRESNPSQRICHQHAVPLGHVC